MPQMLLPFFPTDMTFINELVGFQKNEGKIYYFHGQLPVYSHDEDDINSFRFITSQLVVSGNVKQIEISKAFGIPYVTVKRSVKKLREQGAEGFFRKRKGGVPHVLTSEVLKKVQRLLDNGKSPSEISKKLDLKSNTIRKAIQIGRLHKKKLFQ